MPTTTIRARSSAAPRELLPLFLALGVLGASGPLAGCRAAPPAPPRAAAGARPPAGEATAPPRDENPEERARRVHFDAVLVDGHNDVTTAILDEGFDLGRAGDAPDAKPRTATDLRRLKAGGVDAVFFAVYVASDFVGKPPAQGGGAARRALDMIDVVYEQARRHPDALAIATSVADIERIAAAGKVAALLGIEGGHAIEDSLGALRMFYRLGVRYMTLTHSNTNDWADSSGDQDDRKVKRHGGLSAFGRDVVAEMNRLGMLVDISHVADETALDVLEVARAPVIASHSSARALANHPRNIDDVVLRAVGRNGGVVMVNFFTWFIDPAKARISPKARELRLALRKRWPNDPVRVDAEVRRFVEKHAPGPTPLSVLIDHIDHIAKVAGVDHVGLGSDYDGVPLDGVPEGMDDVSRYPLITRELLRRGYSEADVRKILGGNLLRVMREAERVAAGLQAAERPRATHHR